MMPIRSFEQMLGGFRGNLPRQVKEHEILRIAAELPESLKTENAALVRKEALKWAQRRTVGRLPEEAWREESFQHLSSGRTCMGVRAVSDESDIWALRIDDPDKEVPGRVWSTEVVVGKASRNLGVFSLRLLITSPEDQLALDPHSPGIVLQLAQRPGLCAGKYRITAEPTTVRSDADLQALITQLIDPDRKLPLIVLSVPAFSSTPEASPIDSAVLARATVGLAHVAILPARFTWDLSEQFGKRLSVFEGASRIYLPGFTADSNPFGGHDLFVPKDPYDLSESANILSRLRWSASRASVRRLQLGSLTYRLEILTAILRAKPGCPSSRVRTAFSERDKNILLNTIRAEGGEGVVFKNAPARYTPGRPASGGDALKHKFKASASCAVLSHNSGKRSVQIAVSNDAVNALPLQRFIEIGNVAIPGSAPMPSIDTMIEIEYLYAYRGGALFQPVYKGTRPDKHHPDAYASLKFKPENAEGE
jgi:hypothetical protein